MPTAGEFYSIEVDRIIVSEDRQRKSINSASLNELADSIERNGLLHPIIVSRTLKLVAGERRLRAFKKLGRDKIPIQFFDELTPFDARTAELEENVRRSDLTWQEIVSAIKTYHELQISANDDWSREQTAKGLGYSVTKINKALLIAKNIGENKLISRAENFEAAYRVVRRSIDRIVDTEISQLEVTLGEDAPAEANLEPTPSDENISPRVKPKTNPIAEVANFIEWAAAYSGRRFNFIHCDFPYGINYGKTQYSGSETWEKYDDEEDIFKKLLDTLLSNRDKLFFPSSHLMFWFSMSQYDHVKNQLELGGFAVNPVPLIWHKNKGILPDHMRGPRRVYETAFFASFGDRKIIKAVDNLFYHQVEKKGHISAKPLPMLQYFFQLTVEDHTEMLDPTCGGGTSLGAAISLGATRTVGLDVEQEYVDFANTEARTARNKLEHQEK